MTGRLKVYDADTGTWKYVDAAGGTVKLLRYVPGTFGGWNIGVTATTGPVHGPALTGLPPEAVAVSVEVIGHCTVISPGARFEVYDYGPLDGTGLRAQGFSGKVAGHYEAVSAHYVKLGGTDQIDYKITVPVAGTYTILLYVTGYWVEEDSQAVVAGGGIALGSGTAFPPLPVVGDIFFRTDVDALFKWNGTAWVDDNKMPFPGYFMQGGSFTTTHSAAQTSPQVTVTFPIAFSGTPVYVGVVSGNLNYGGGMGGNLPTNTGFNYASWRYSGATTGSVVHTYVAFGPR